MKRNIYKLLIVGIISIFPTIKANAATGYIDIYASQKEVIVGQTTTVSVYCKADSVIGTCEYTLDYNSNVLKLTSIGDTSSCNSSGYCMYGVNSKSSAAKTFTFKVISAGSSKVSAKSISMLDMNTLEEMSTSVDATTITGKTQSSNNTPSNNNQKPNNNNNNNTQTNYSTNNNLSSLTIEGYKLEPEFNKDKTEYTVTLPSNIEKIKVSAQAEDNKATIKGTGEIEVSEGENKIEIIVTSEKGTTKTYIIKATVKDENPIEITINNKKYTVVKRKSLLTKPETYEEKEIEINQTKIPAFYNETTKYTLVGLKDENGTINLFIYDDIKNKYIEYKEISFNTIKIIPTTPTKPLKDSYKTTITINDNKIEAYKFNELSNYSYIYCINTETGEESWYRYEETENTLQKYYEDENKHLEEKINESNKIIIILGSIVILLGITTIISLFKRKKTKKIKNKENELKTILDE